MALSPFRGFWDLQGQMKRTLEDVFGGLLRRSEDLPRTQLTEWAPAVDVLSEDGNLLIRAELPGLKQEDVDITLQNNVLTISGERKAEREEERGGSIAAVSVAAHECGHAIQDGTGYLPMKLRAGLFPIVNLGAQLWFPLFFAGIVMGGGGLGQLFIQLAVLAFAGVLAFHVLTLPVLGSFRDDRSRGYKPLPKPPDRTMRLATFW